MFHDVLIYSDRTVMLLKPLYCYVLGGGKLIALMYLNCTYFPGVTLTTLVAGLR